MSAKVIDLCPFTPDFNVLLLVLRSKKTSYFYALISQHSIQQIQSRIDIIDIIGSFVKLKKRGANYLGVCPFHNEKTPSFTVSPSKEIYKCFGCGKSGNAIGFLMEHEKYSYTEALRWLANKYNIELEETEVSPEYKAQLAVADSLYIINQFARDYFSRQLHETEEGRDIALAYLRERGFRDDIIQKFQLGYSPQTRDSFTRAALEAQYNPDLLVKSGLVAHREESYYDNYRGRIIFPVHNQSGKVLGFGARVIKSNDKAPKYINTPENEIYIKSKILYGAYFARMAIDKHDECLLVEGYTDVISLHQAGIENVVASGGTSLTLDQLRLIKKYSNHLTIIYDGDQAGVKAALRGLDLALEEGLHVRLVLIPDAEDPDSYVRKVGKEAFIDFVKREKKDFILFQLQVALREAGDDIARKADIVNQVSESISRISKTEDFTRRQDYIKQVAGILRIDEAGLNDLVNKHIRDKIARQESRQRTDETALNADGFPPVEPEPGSAASLDLFNQDDQHEQALLRCLFDHGLRPWTEELSVADYLLQEMQEEESGEWNETITNALYLQMIGLYQQWYRSGIQPTAKNFLYLDDQTISQAVVRIMAEENDISPNWKKHYEGKIATREDLYREEVMSTLTYLKLRKIKKMIAENQAELERSSDEAEQLMLLQTHQLLKQMERDLTQTIGTVIMK